MTCCSMVYISITQIIISLPLILNSQMHDKRFLNSCASGYRLKRKQLTFPHKSKLCLHTVDGDFLFKYLTDKSKIKTKRQNRNKVSSEVPVD